MHGKEGFEPGKFSSEEEEKNPEPISHLDAVVEETPLSRKAHEVPTFNP